ncbi:MAG: PQQ-binding-like beta-propeller repeat protein [candidate division KSB1 bacterium]|nr:PQQ-binding-like beta-propeller repeat protein [candidate division KSB1 bacterium]MDZ7342286.1 PQQ-binding-like beta-propeller repeat protein [candidate division KSB1 bacterium]
MTRTIYCISIPLLRQSNTPIESFKNKKVPFGEAMKKLIYIILISALLLLLLCHKQSPTEPPNDNIHPQVDIPWPSLANSPWPIAHGDVQCTGRSKYQGPREGKVCWTFTEGGMQEVNSSPVIGEDGTIYFTDRRHLYAVNPDGSLKWKFTPGRNIQASPMLGRGEVIYLGTGNLVTDPLYTSGCYYALNSDGKIIWEFHTSAFITNYSDAIGLDGTIYFADTRGTLYALNSSGTLKWSTRGLGGLKGGEYMSIAISPDGLILYAFGEDSTLNAIDAQSSQLIWKYHIGSDIYSSPLVDCEGNIYFYAREMDQNVICSVKPDGQLLWKYQGEEAISLAAVVHMHLDKDGNIYFVNSYQICSLSHEGNLRWAKKLPDDSNTDTPILGDCEGNIYITFRFRMVLCLDQQGNKLFECEIPKPARGLYNGAISDDGHLYICSEAKLSCIQ